MQQTLHWGAQKNRIKNGLWKRALKGRKVDKLNTRTIDRHKYTDLWVLDPAGCQYCFVKLYHLIETVSLLLSPTLAGDRRFEQ